MGGRPRFGGSGWSLFKALHPEEDDWDRQHDERTFGKKLRFIGLRRGFCRFCAARFYNPALKCYAPSTERLLLVSRPENVLWQELSNADLYGIPTQ